MAFLVVEDDRMQCFALIHLRLLAPFGMSGLYCVPGYNGGTTTPPAKRTHVCLTLLLRGVDKRRHPVAAAPPLKTPTDTRVHPRRQPRHSPMKPHYPPRNPAFHDLQSLQNSPEQEGADGGFLQRCRGRDRPSPGIFCTKVMFLRTIVFNHTRLFLVVGSGPF